MTPAKRSRIGSTQVSVTALGLGGAPLGDLFSAVDEEAALRTIGAALKAGIGYLDVAPQYGAGLAEKRFGAALEGVPRDSYTLSTKVGRLVVDAAGDEAREDAFVGVPENGKRATFDFSGDGVRRSLDQSLERLRLDRIDIAFIHDPDDHWEAALTGAYPALAQLRSEGVVGAIGVGMNQVEMLTRFVSETDIDVVLCAGRYTLLDQSAALELFPACLERGVSVVMGGVYNSGVLANPYADDVHYDYLHAPESVVAQARRLADICAAYGTPLRAAALQFPMRNRAVTSVLTGVRSELELADNLEMATTDVPDALWAQLAAAATAPLGGGR
ncbi:MAG: aldo/keto reductase [Actinomycetota bacterium]